MTGPLLLVLVPLLPLVLAPVAPLVDPARGRGSLLLLLAALPGVAASLAVAPGTTVELPWLLLGGRLGLDQTGGIFLLFTSVLWLLATVYARGYLRDDPKRRRFFSLFLAAMAGNFGVLVAQDIPLFYLCFALMSFCSYVLVVHGGDAEATRAARIYLALVVVGELFLFSGLLLAYGSAGTLGIAEAAAGAARSPLRGTIVLLLVGGFGIKAGIVPLHLWLPLAHPVAPTPASAVLSGAMIKAGLFGLVRFLPLGHADLPGAGEALLVAGVLSAFYGVAVGIFQENPKTVLAYSSISQMGFLTVALGLGLGASGGWESVAGALSLYALHHGLAKGALFLGVGVAPAAGGGKGGKVIAVGLLWPALALAGLPLTSGALAKAALKGSLAFAPPWWGEWGGLLLSAAAVGTTVLMGRFFFVLLRKKGGHPPHRSMLAAWGILVSAGIALPWFGADPGTVRYLFTPASAWSALWPVALGVALTWAGWRGAVPAALRRLPIPPGDLVVFLEKGAGALRRVGRTGTERPSRSSAFFLRRASDPLEGAERWLTGWSAVGVLFLLLLFLQILLTAF